MSGAGSPCLRRFSAGSSEVDLPRGQVELTARGSTGSTLRTARLFANAKSCKRRVIAWSAQVLPLQPQAGASACSLASSREAGAPEGVIEHQELDVVQRRALLGHGRTSSGESSACAIDSKRSACLGLVAPAARQLQAQLRGLGAGLCREHESTKGGWTGGPPTGQGTQSTTSSGGHHTEELANRAHIERRGNSHRRIAALASPSQQLHRVISPRAFLL